MTEKYNIITYKLDTARFEDSEETRYKIVAYQTSTGERVTYTYDDDETRGIKRVTKRLPDDAQVTTEKGY